MAYKQLKLWFDAELAELLAEKLLSQAVSFDKASFVKSVSKKVSALELKDRVECIADELNVHLLGNYQKKVHYLQNILGPENEKETGMFKEFYWVMPIAKFVEKYGLEHFDLSMQAVYEITKRNTGEYTIRPYLEKFPEKTLDTMLRWSQNPNKHVRRLASEGVRPRLPWASKLDDFVEDPSPILPILENLKDDPSKYVQKSVANCVNDILKDNPEIAKTLVESWVTDASKERKWIIKHALRNLIKKQDPWALRVVS
ncbi:DNA alkylation repair protein [Flagellimonas allohymeniacidonis]|uniref:3-methyladenine DNA glycosylase n=1 Tax=Flagellimonas allohymeniacidonis TaxID=2517819 RepID=A0A4V2HST1_9FLAO|nr:DNA alkylation repair protein [Allomuricauda hymeniacidonis]TAI48920.1 3-methyladenine DNA glycosylase [Allomuricauda hymeniacidonis]